MATSYPTDGTTSGEDILFLEGNLAEKPNPTLGDVLEVLQRLTASPGFCLHAPGDRMIGVINKCERDMDLLKQIEDIANSASLEAYRLGKPQASDAYRDIQRLVYIVGRQQQATMAIDEHSKSVNSIVSN